VVVVSDVEVGIQLVEYSNWINSMVIPSLSTAVDEAQAACDLLSGAAGDPIYQGRAADQLSMFYTNMLAHAQKLVYFHTVAAKFLANAYEAFDFTDQQLAVIVETVT
jgi:hypothetical protein